jgi:phosphoenolpyruvate carboxykinase (ATP)
MSIGATRTIMNAIHDGVLENAEYEKLPVFNLSYPKNIPGVDPSILNPETSWVNK